MLHCISTQPHTWVSLCVCVSPCVPVLLGICVFCACAFLAAASGINGGGGPGTFFWVCECSRGLIPIARQAIPDAHRASHQYHPAREDTRTAACRCTIFSCDPCCVRSRRVGGRAGAWVLKAASPFYPHPTPCRRPAVRAPALIKCGTTPWRTAPQRGGNKQQQKF